MVDIIGNIKDTIDKASKTVSKTVSSVSQSISDIPSLTGFDSGFEPLLSPTGEPVFTTGYMTSLGTLVSFEPEPTIITEPEPSPIYRGFEEIFPKVSLEQITGISDDKMDFGLSGFTSGFEDIWNGGVQYKPPEIPQMPDIFGAISGNGEAMEFPDVFAGITGENGILSGLQAAGDSILDPLGLKDKPYLLIGLAILAAIVTIIIVYVVVKVYTKEKRGGAGQTIGNPIPVAGIAASRFAPKKFGIQYEK